MTEMFLLIDKSKGVDAYADNYVLFDNYEEARKEFDSRIPEGAMVFATPGGPSVPGTMMRSSWADSDLGIMMLAVRTKGAP